MTAYTKIFGAMALASALACSGAPAFAVADLVLKRELDTRSAITCTTETAFGNFVADAVKTSRSADIALVPCAVIRGNRTYGKGEAFDTTAATAEIAGDANSIQLDVTGLQLLDALEQALATVPAAAGTFPQVAGLRLVADTKKPVGQRIVKLTVNGAALDFQRSYRLATTEDMVKSLAPLAAAKRIEGQATPVSAAVSAYLQSVGVRDIKVLGRIKFVQ